MSAAVVTPPPATFPKGVTEGVTAAIEQCMQTILGKKPTRISTADQLEDHSCIAAMISFVGDVSWTMTWILPKTTAPILIQKFTGFPIEFESRDMGDAVGELVNVVAGEVVAQLEKRRMKSKMSLPVVIRGKTVELITDSASTVTRIDFQANEGWFWLQLVAAKSNAVRMPGT